MEINIGDFEGEKKEVKEIYRVLYMCCSIIMQDQKQESQDSFIGERYMKRKVGVVSVGY